MYLVAAAFAVAGILDHSYWLAGMFVLMALFYLLTMK
jgi:hypothetical protein